MDLFQEFLKLVFLCPAFRAEPVVRQLFKWRSRTDPVIRITYGWIINIATDNTLPFLHLSSLLIFAWQIKRLQSLILHKSRTAQAEPVKSALDDLLFGHQDLVMFVFLRG
jgi:hypothetical protein